jgi:hypothetical protein
VVKTFLIANLAVVSVWIGPTTPCRALPSGFSSTPASLLVLAPHHRNHHHYWHHWRWSRSPPLWYGAPAIGTHMMPLPGYGAPETGSSQAPTPPAATVPELPQGGPLSGKQETASQRPVDPVGWTRLPNRCTNPFSRLSYSRAPTRGGPAHPDEQEALGPRLRPRGKRTRTREWGDTMPARPPPAR